MMMCMIYYTNIYFVRVFNIREVFIFEGYGYRCIIMYGECCITYLKYTHNNLILINPLGGTALVILNSLREPQGNFLLCALNRVGSVTDVSADVDTEITSNRSRCRVSRICGTKHHTSSLDNIVSFPYHSNNGSHRHVLDQSSEETFGGKIAVMRLEVRLGRRNHFQGHQLESLLLESRNNISNETSLDTVRLHHNVCLFSRHCLLVCLCDEINRFLSGQERLVLIGIGDIAQQRSTFPLFLFPLKS